MTDEKTVEVSVNLSSETNETLTPSELVKQRKICDKCGNLLLHNSNICQICKQNDDLKEEKKQIDDEEVMPFISTLKGKTIAKCQTFKN